MEAGGAGGGGGAPVPQSSVADKEWLSRRSEDLLDIIKILYKGREADVKKLEKAQEKMKAAGADRAPVGPDQSHVVGKGSVCSA
jgi:hypothetical protein